MKLMSVTVPVLIVALTVVAVWGLGVLAVRASAVSTQTSIELLRMHLRVERLHEQLLQHSKDRLAADLRSLRPGSAAAAAAASAASPATAAPAASPVRPWPEGTAGPNEVRP